MAHRSVALAPFSTNFITCSSYLVHTRRFAPRAAEARSQGRIEQHANEADREVYKFRCKLTTSKMPRAPCSRIPTRTHEMYIYLVPAGTYEESKEIQEGSPPNSFLVGTYGLRRVTRDGRICMLSMSSQVGTHQFLK